MPVYVRAKLSEWERALTSQQPSLLRSAGCQRASLLVGNGGSLTQPAPCTVVVVPLCLTKGSSWVLTLVLLPFATSLSRLGSYSFSGRLLVQKYLFLVSGCRRF